MPSRPCAKTASGFSDRANGSEHLPGVTATRQGKKPGVPLYEFELREGATILSTGTFWSERTLESGEPVDWLPVPGRVREVLPTLRPGTFRLIVDAAKGASPTAGPGA